MIGAISCAVAIGAGAFGAHALEGRVDARGLDLWEVGARYLMYSGLGTILASLVLEESLRQGARAAQLCAGSLALGGWVFAATLFAMALGAPKWFGAVTPLGGLCMILGFLLLAWQALPRR